VRGLSKLDRQKFTSIVGQAKTDLAHSRNGSFLNGSALTDLEGEVVSIDEIVGHVRQQDALNLIGVILMSETMGDVGESVALVKNRNRVWFASCIATV